MRNQDRSEFVSSRDYELEEGDRERGIGTPALRDVDDERVYAGDIVETADDGREVYEVTRAVSHRGGLTVWLTNLNDATEYIWDESPLRLVDGE